MPKVDIDPTEPRTQYSDSVAGMRRNPTSSCSEFTIQ